MALHLAPAVVFASGAWVAGCSCEDEQGDFALASDPKLSVTPESITFAAATPDQPEQRSVTISNVGAGPLTDFSYRLQKDEGSFAIAPPAAKSLGEGESAVIEVTYRPDDDRPDDDVLIIEASNNQRAEVILGSVPPRRDLQCDPATITFTGAPDEVISAEVDVVNIGSLPATITAFDMEDGFEISVTEHEALELVLAPAASTTLTMVFEPFGGGMATDKLRIVTAEAPGIFTCDVRSNTPQPSIQIDPARVDFGAVLQDETQTADITVTNVGSAPLTVGAPAFLRGGAEEIVFLDPPTEDSVLDPGASLVLTAAYTAGTSAATTTAVLVTDDPNNPQAAIPMLGRPRLGDLSVSPEELAFGAVGQLQVSTRTLTLINNGTEPVTVSSLAFDGAGEFRLEPDNAFPPTTGFGTGVVPAEGIVELRVTYAPTDVGPDAATLQVASDDPDEPLIGVPLSGTGLERGVCLIQIRPDPLNFGIVARGTVKVISANITNTGGGSCTFGSANAMGFLNDAFGIEGTSIEPGGTLGPQETLNVEVRFAPTTAEFNLGKLTLDVRDPNNNNAPVLCNAGLRCQQDPDLLECGFMPPPCGVDMQGFSGPSNIAVIPGQLDFGLVTLGCSSQASTVTVYNTGSTTLDILDVRLGEECTDEFQLRGTPGPPYPVPVLSGASVTLQVAYTPAELGVDRCSLIIESNASDTESLLRVPMRGEGTNTSEQIDVFEQVDGRKVDVLFVIDTSGSMGDEQDNMAANLDRFMATAEVFDNDFHIGVIHLDLDGILFFGGGQFGAGELIGDPSFLTRDHPDVLGEFRRRVRLGASGGGPEAGLEAAHRALSDPFSTDEGTACVSDDDCEPPYSTCGLGSTCGGRNVGFIRDDASLEIVMLSDEEDQSSATPDFYVQFFQSIKGFRNAALLHVSTIVGADPITNEPIPCDGADGGRRYAEVANATGGTVGSICASDFSNHLQNIGNRAFGLRVEFFLSRVAEPASVQVRVDGNDQPTGWTYDEATNSVIFERDTVPPAGSIIEIEYEARCF